MNDILISLKIGKSKLSKIRQFFEIEIKLSGAELARGLIRALGLRRDWWQSRRQGCTMKSFFLIAGGVIAAIAVQCAAQSSHSVSGYTKHDGTYVAPHYQTDPNSSRTDNWSSKPNSNPYTGQAGTVDPYAPKSSNDGYSRHKTSSSPW